MSFSYVLDFGRLNATRRVVVEHAMAADGYDDVFDTWRSEC